MVATLRRGLLLVILALVLLMGLIGWTMHVVASSPAHHSGFQSSHAQTAYICPPPPFDCR
ncbi:MAG: hypothetical protein NVSMB27_09650 [Ktedonobacteraceae bacterium]